MTEKSVSDAPPATRESFERQLEDLVATAHENGVSIRGGFEVRRGEDAGFEVVITEVRR